MRLMVGCIDTLIVGGGLAGTLLAFELVRAGQRVRIVDSPVASASRAASGLMNPLTGPRLASPPDLLPRCSAARAHYDRLSRQLDHPLVSPLEIVRICRDDSERERAVGHTHASRSAWTDHSIVSGFKAPFGAFRIDHGWRLDLAALCSMAVRVANVGMQFDDASFDWHPILARPAPPRWRGLRVGAVVSCEGAAALNNPIWRGLPLQPDGGESLIIRMDRDLHKAISASVTLVPLGSRRYWLGATHQPGQVSSGPTITGRAAL
ncbi:MAG TPA: FAD-dependent oxidoreductase [Candidatus Acidoferrales bacterium]|nr:FAD-dependent oxidoreductase [Candidatus Acidoferrales bacterium]